VTIQYALPEAGGGGRKLVYMSYSKTKDILSILVSSNAQEVGKKMVAHIMVFQSALTVCGCVLCNVQRGAESVGYFVCISCHEIQNVCFWCVWASIAEKSDAYGRILNIKYNSFLYIRNNISGSIM